MQSRSISAGSPSSYRRTPATARRPISSPVVSRKLPTKLWAGSETKGPGPLSGGRNSSTTPDFNQPTVLDGEKLGMEVSCPEAPWPCACPNIAPAQNRPAKIVTATLHFLALFVGKNADMDSLPIFVTS